MAVGVGERFSPNIPYKPEYMTTAFSPLAFLEEKSKKFRKCIENVTKVLIIKPTRCTNFSNLFLE
jgi:hypothetical protein